MLYTTEAIVRMSTVDTRDTEHSVEFGMTPEVSLVEVQRAAFGDYLTFSPEEIERVKAGEPAVLPDHPLWADAKRLLDARNQLTESCV